MGQEIGQAIPDWSARPPPQKAPLQGRWCRLEPIDVANHADVLFAIYRAASDESDWTYLPIERPQDLHAYRRLVVTLAASSDPLHFTILDGADQPLGTAALMRMDPSNGVIEVGHIVFSRSLKRTRVATDAIFTMMRYVFDDLGYRRFEWKCDSLNAPSRRAALRYGFTFEGIFRQAIVTKGRNRDTAWYAMIDKDWPREKAALEAWLTPENFDADGWQRQSLLEMRRLLGTS